MSRIHEASKRISGEPVEPRVPSNLERYALEKGSKPEETPRESRVSNTLMFSIFRSAGAVGIVDRLRHWIERSRVYAFSAFGWRGPTSERKSRPPAQPWPLNVVSPDFAKLDAAFRIDEVHVREPAGSPYAHSDGHDGLSDDPAPINGRPDTRIHR